MSSHKIQLNKYKSVLEEMNFKVAMKKYSYMLMKKLKYIRINNSR